MLKKMFTRSKMSCYILFVQYLALLEDLREVFCVRNFADYVRDPQI